MASAKPEAAGEDVQQRWDRALRRLRNHLFERDVGPLRPQLLRYCTRLAGDAAGGEDLEQDTLFRAFDPLCQICGGPSNLKAYLFRIATNLWIDRQRRRKREIRAQALLAVSPPPPFADDGVLERLARLTQVLTPRELEVFLLRDVQGYTAAETARRLGISEAAAKMAGVRARRRARLSYQA
jgi:RNA polymerase sigma-70 factor (ECF subfamily)